VTSPNDKIMTCFYNGDTHYCLRIKKNDARAAQVQKQRRISELHDLSKVPLIPEFEPTGVCE